MIQRVGMILLAVGALIFVPACSSAATPIDGQVRMPASSSDLEGEQYEAVVEMLRDAGFVNVQADALGDLITGWLKGPGEVAEVEVNGVASFDDGEVFDEAVAIVVSYHSFPAETSPSREVDPSSAEPTPEATQLSQEPGEPSPEAAVEVITTESNPDFASLVTLGDNCDASIGEFAAAHRGRHIAFDGYIGSMAPHGGFDTRFDILIVAGDFDPDVAWGPSFLYRDVNTTFDLHYVDEDIPDSIGVGDNLRVTAEVVEFDSVSCLLYLEPVATEFR